MVKKRSRNSSAVRESTKYIADTLKSVGVSLVVSGWIGIMFKADDRGRLISIVLSGIITNITGYYFLRAKEKQKRR